MENTASYPFAQEFITDSHGKICKVILNIDDYEKLLEALADETLYQNMTAVRHEIPLTLDQALQELNSED